MHNMRLYQHVVTSLRFVYINALMINKCTTTHFDTFSGTHYKYGKEILLRAKLEQKISETYGEAGPNILSDLIPLIRITTLTFNLSR